MACVGQRNEKKMCEGDEEGTTCEVRESYF